MTNVVPEPEATDVEVDEEYDEDDRVDSVALEELVVLGVLAIEVVSANEATAVRDVVSTAVVSTAVLVDSSKTTSELVRLVFVERLVVTVAALVVAFADAFASSVAIGSSSKSVSVGSGTSPKSDSSVLVSKGATISTGVTTTVEVATPVADGLWPATKSAALANNKEVGKRAMSRTNGTTQEAKPQICVHHLREQQQYLYAVLSRLCDTAYRSARN